MTEPSEQLATLPTARMRDAHRLADACIGSLIRAVPRSNGDPPALASGKSQESVTPSMSSLALAVDTPQTRTKAAAAAVAVAVAAAAAASSTKAWKQTRRPNAAQAGHLATNQGA
ncbi:hypothetical protein [Xanthomonas phaseoli]|uniref:Uncharacterized protein n=1 Tax=Xanthomonas phaseoli pv. dieffenbachiae TaxID=92828 RepID=A0A1V9GXA3_9XANT|nr:hypothetical protein [Xanthomonas phaseoli]MBO9834588.1 hypothetical protein [Xanthomonas phaseoli pv. dieffenbachiae]MBO9838221.1 hypothetical protein [Xanthomonas phaseoli pv. dieffenbachiae]MBO9840104.1 hypothetical protein [Xanthomonas phaseoli pv. dieffenbachiae]MBO9854682.1 hypothetical protein [Xanthomonas phaseoli pv. dieffenbachiae]MBO9862944.1 hypothetical protein [Xanthomonas phaseoli pv. dieffenbachiae]